MVRAVATDEPQMAPNMPEANIEATESEPLVPRNMALAAPNKSLEKPDTAATPPIKVNRGTTENV